MTEQHLFGRSPRRPGPPTGVRYVLRPLRDLAVIVLPLLRPLALLKLVTVIGALNRRAGSALRGRAAINTGDRAATAA